MEFRKKGEEPSKFPSKMSLNAEKHWSGCCYRISASQTHRALPGEPFPPTPKQTANISLHLPLCCAAVPTCPWQGSSMGGHSRWHLEGGKCISQLCFLPFGVPNTARDGCWEKQLLPCAPHGNHQAPVESTMLGQAEGQSFLSWNSFKPGTLIISSTGSPFQLSLQ